MCLIIHCVYASLLTLRESILSKCPRENIWQFDLFKRKAEIFTSGIRYFNHIYSGMGTDRTHIIESLIHFRDMFPTSITSITTPRWSNGRRDISCIKTFQFTLSSFLRGGISTDNQVVIICGQLWCRHTVSRPQLWYASKIEWWYVNRTQPMLMITMVANTQYQRNLTLKFWNTCVYRWVK